MIARLVTNARVVGALGMRSVRQTFRRPQLMAPIIIFPSLLLAVQTGGAAAAVSLPGFPSVNGFLDFILAGAMLQSLMLAGNSGGIAMAVDLEMGFTDRLFAAPISRFSIVLGRLAGTAALGLVTAFWFLLVGLIFGVHFEGGVPGVLVVILMVVLASMAMGGLGMSIALRTGKASVTQGMFPFVFVILFLSSAFFPQGLMVEPAKAIAKYNPLSFIVEGMRNPIISSVSWSEVGDGFLAILGVAVFGLLMSAAALRHRLKVGS